MINQVKYSRVALYHLVLKVDPGNNLKLQFHYYNYHKIRTMLKIYKVNLKLNPVKSHNIMALDPVL